MKDPHAEQYIFLITISETPAEKRPANKPRAQKKTGKRRSNRALNADAAQSADQSPHLEDADGGEDILDR